MSSIAGHQIAVVIRRRRVCACAVVLMISSICHGQPIVQAPPDAQESDASANAIAEWNRLRTLPSGEIDDPLGFLVNEAGAFRRLTLMIQDLQATQVNAPLDPKLQVALLRSLYLAASIDGKEPEYLLRWAGEVCDSSDVPAVRAEAAYRILIDDLMQVSANSPWNCPLSELEFDLLDEYLDCFGNTPRAVSAVKRIAEDASMRRDDRDLRACRELVQRTSPQHPIGPSFVGQARGAESVGKPFAPTLRTQAGGELNWSGLSGRPTIVLLVDVEQTPSFELLTELLGESGSGETQRYQLVVVQINVSAERRKVTVVEGASSARTDHILSRVNSNRLIRLTRGWREPLLTEFDIRTLPTAFVLDSAGLLRQMVRHSDWSMADTIRGAVDRDSIEPALTPETNP
ncbi:MAG: hypothetical protein H6818_13645 [Phycisphaerales bacterium]|nr:hypothetical protein [Phycisphaerales bacterium]MCB9862154.1 hypothetical protein [Phycisphaerales bacterium]